MKVLLDLLKEFQMEQIDKFVKRIHKHPLQQSVTDDGFDWRNYDLKSVENHLLQEIAERFPDLAIKLGFHPQELSLDSPESEDIDIANLAFVDWAIRRIRSQ